MATGLKEGRGAIRGDRKVIFGWAMYDWANSAYSTTIAVAILPMYFAGVVVPAAVSPGHV